MDNLTHSLVGMAVADAASTWSGERDGERSWPGLRPAAFAASLLANNFPDVDVAYTWITRPKPLGSLLHHRGHTHTLLLALPLGLCVALAVLRLYERKHGQANRSARTCVLGLGLLGGALHLLLDYGNNYGVHPFWPLSSRWSYGDAIFIVEPLWLAALLPAVARALQTRWLRWLLYGLLLLLVALTAFLPFVHRASLLALIVVAAISVSVAQLTPRRWHSVAALGLCAAVALAFAAGSTRAGAVLRTLAARDFPRFQRSDVALQPMPGTPLCLNALALGEEDDQYRVLMAQVAVLPDWLPARACPRDSAARPTAPLTPLPAGRDAALRWHAAYSTPLASLRELARADCRFRALLGFARVPYHAPRALDGVAGDLRFDRSEGLDFADLSLAAPVVCPELVPAWTPPRAELLD